jgi:hypothetical protein
MKMKKEKKEKIKRNKQENKKEMTMKGREARRTEAISGKAGERWQLANSEVPGSIPNSILGKDSRAGCANPRRIKRREILYAGPYVEVR